MADLNLSMPYVLQNEGGYTVDDGGPTNFGIVEQDLATYRGIPVSTITAEDIKNLTVAEATAIYAKEYWQPMGLSAVNDQSIATAIFDAGVNMGIGTGARLAQRVVGATGDGIIGPNTLLAINTWTRANFIPPFANAVLTHYQGIVASDPGKYSRYFPGWSARAKRLLTLA